MSWLKVDDKALTHPKVMRLHSMRDPVVTGEAVVGFVMLASSWSGQHLTDCFIPEYIGQIASPLYWERLSAAAVRVQMLRKGRVDGIPGWLVEIGDDEVFHLLLKEEVMRKRELRRAARRNDVQISVLLRDGDQCRYCDLPVNPKSNGARGRQLDHPDPAVPDALVVACRECNARKGSRTPEQAGMTLLPPATDRGFDLYLTEHSRDWLQRRDALPRPDTSQVPDPADARPDQGTAATSARTGSTPASAAPPATNGTNRPTTGPAPVSVAGQHTSGRDGTGLVGSGRASSAQRRRRGSRGRRGRSHPPDDPQGRT